MVLLANSMLPTYHVGTSRGFCYVFRQPILLRICISAKLMYRCRHVYGCERSKCITIMIMSVSNRLHVSVKTTNILVLSYYELIVVFIF